VRNSGIFYSTASDFFLLENPRFLDPVADATPALFTRQQSGFHKDLVLYFIFFGFLSFEATLKHAVVYLAVLRLLLGVFHFSFRSDRGA